MLLALERQLLERQKLKRQKKGAVLFRNLARVLGIRDVKPPETPTNELQEVRGLRLREPFSNDLGRRTSGKKFYSGFRKPERYKCKTPLNDPSMVLAENQLGIQGRKTNGPVRFLRCVQL